MRFSDEFRKTVGFLYGPKSDGTKDFIGTFFLVQEDFSDWEGGENRSTVKFMVTARHVVEERLGVEAVMRMATGEVASWSLGPWIVPDDTEGQPKIDLAVQIFDPDGRAKYLFRALPVGYAEPEERSAELGQPVLFAGLLALRELTRSAIPVIRSGSVGALSQPDVVWTGPSSEHDWTSPVSHLVDVRSRGGFSGSPCFVQFYLTIPQPDPPLTEAQLVRVAQAGNKAERLGEVATLTHWWGVFASHVEEAGIGTVVPVSVIKAFLGSEKVMSAKKDEEKRIKDEEKEVRPIAQSAEGSEFDAFADLTRKLIRVPKKEIDEKRRKA